MSEFMNSNWYVVTIYPDEFALSKIGSTLDERIPFRIVTQMGMPPHLLAPLVKDLAILTGYSGADWGDHYGNIGGEPV